MINPQQAWQATLGQLQMDMSKAAYNTWVKDTEFITYDDSVFTIGVQNAYARDWLESRLSDTVVRLLTGLTGEPQEVSFVVSHFDESSCETSALEDVPISNEKNFNDNPSINARYTFQSFVVGSSNRLAHAACMAVAENPAKAYNPLFLYGGVGLGKTHLLHAIGNSLTQQGLEVVYASSEEFTNDLINSIRTHNTMEFRERYRNVDALMIDDIQFIAGKESTQEEFFHTFNALHGQDKQIVMTSDRPPKAMITLEERLCSRFEWGLIVDLQPPDLETRIAILRSKAERANKEIPVDILELIARKIQSNIRELEGALTRVLAYAELSGLPITQALVNSALADLLPQHTQIEPDQVVDAVASAFGVTIAQLKGRDRSREIALPRQIAMYLLREEGNASLPQIGAVLGGRDHTTVMYACEKVADLIERDDRLRKQIFAIRENMSGHPQFA
jgi:chromosomal replication initiator protein